ncbi:MAG: tetratricopeptide repeat protein [bacterium]
MKARYQTICWLITSILMLFPMSMNAQEEPMSISGVELLRKGEQVSITLQTSGKPIYELNENLKARTLVVKFRNTKAAFADGRRDRLFNDPQVEGIRFLDMEPDTWAQFKLRKDDLIFDMVPGSNPGQLVFRFRPLIQLPPVTLPPDPEPATIALEALDYDDSNPEFTSLTFSFTGPPRLFVLENPQDRTVRLRFADTAPGDSFTLTPYEDGRVRVDELTTDPNQVFVTLGQIASDFRLEKDELSDPARWVIRIYGQPIFQDIAIEEEDSSLTPDEAAKLDREKRVRNAEIRAAYQEGENHFRKSEYDLAIAQFQKAYASGKNGVGEFEDEWNPLAIQSLFRIADTKYTQLERRRGRNYHQAIDDYTTAIRVANSTEIAKDLIPHAQFRIGRSYQQMRFSQEANTSYELLRRDFPSSYEAQESSFWQALNQIARREWGQAILQFEEYLKAMPNPKFIHIAYYKIAQAYYQQQKFPEARDFFDRARALDSRYVQEDPMLLFHMGETYYENADYDVAREIFQLLLDRYPDADFSKFVALRLGDFLRDEGKEDEAIAAYSNAIRSYSLEIALMGKLRIANIQAERPYSDEYRQALRTYDEIITLYPDSPQVEEAKLRKGLTLTLYGAYREAIAALEGFMEEYPQSVYVRRNIIQENIDENLKGLVDRAYQRQDDLGVVTIYRDYQAKYLLNFRFDTTLFQVAHAHQKLGFHNEAMDLYRFLESRVEGPMLELLQLQAAETLIQADDFQQARDQLARFLQRYPDSVYDADVRKKLADVYKQAKEFESAALVYEQAIEKYEQDTDLLRAEVVPELYYELGLMYEEMGRYTEAAEAFQKSIATYNHPLIEPDVPNYVVQSHFRAAEMLYKVRNDERALAQYEQAIVTYTNWPDERVQEQINWARYQTGVLHKDMGQLQQALEIFGDLMEKTPASPALWQQLSSEQHQALSRQLAYENYLND